MNKKQYIKISGYGFLLVGFLNLHILFASEGLEISGGDIPIGTIWTAAIVSFVLAYLSFQNRAK